MCYVSVVFSNSLVYCTPTRYHYDETRPKENFPIGDAVVKLDSLGLTDQPVDKQFKLTNPSDGQSEGEVGCCDVMHNHESN